MLAGCPLSVGRCWHRAPPSSLSAARWPRARARACHRVAGAVSLITKETNIFPISLAAIQSVQNLADGFACGSTPVSAAPPAISSLVGSPTSISPPCRRFQAAGKCRQSLSWGTCRFANNRTPPFFDRRFNRRLSGRARDHARVWPGFRLRSSLPGSTS
jgi:hypothetical protein